MVEFFRVLFGPVVWRVRNWDWQKVLDWLKEDRYKRQRRVVLGCGLLALSLVILLACYCGGPEIHRVSGTPKVNPKVP